MSTSGGTSSGGGHREALGQAFGVLVLFPIMAGLLSGSIAFFLGLDFEAFAVAVAGLAFLFAVFIMVVKVGFVLFIRFWPILIPVLIIIFILRKVL